MEKRKKLDEITRLDSDIKKHWGTLAGLDVRKHDEETSELMTELQTLTAKVGDLDAVKKHLSFHTLFSLTLLYCSSFYLTPLMRDSFT